MCLCAVCGLITPSCTTHPCPTQCPLIHILSNEFCIQWLCLQVLHSFDIDLSLFVKDEQYTTQVPLSSKGTRYGDIAFNVGAAGGRPWRALKGKPPDVQQLASCLHLGWYFCCVAQAKPCSSNVFQLELCSWAAAATGIAHSCERSSSGQSGRPLWLMQALCSLMTLL